MDIFLNMGRQMTDVKLLDTYQCLKPFNCVQTND